MVVVYCDSKGGGGTPNNMVHSHLYLKHGHPHSRLNLLQLGTKGKVSRYPGCPSSGPKRMLHTDILGRVP